MRLLLAVALTFLSCGTPPDDPDAGMLEPTLSLGTGADVFTPAADVEVFPLVSGCQGSQHVWVALRAEDIVRQGTIIDLALRRASDGEVVSQTFHVRVSFQEVEGEDYVELVGLTLVVSDPDVALDQDLILTATITDREDASVTAEQTIRIAWDEDGGCG